MHRFGSSILTRLIFFWHFSLPLLIQSLHKIQLHQHKLLLVLFVQSKCDAFNYISQSFSFFNLSTAETYGLYCKALQLRPLVWTSDSGWKMANNTIGRVERSGEVFKILAWRLRRFDVLQTCLQCSHTTRRDLGCDVLWTGAKGIGVQDGTWGAMSPEQGSCASNCNGTRGSMFYGLGSRRLTARRVLVHDIFWTRLLGLKLQDGTYIGWVRCPVDRVQRPLIARRVIWWDNL